MASTAALDALEGDPSFMAHNCNCRNQMHMGKKDYKNKLEKMLAELDEVQNTVTEEDPSDNMDVV